MTNARVKFSNVSSSCLQDGMQKVHALGVGIGAANPYVNARRMWRDRRRGLRCQPMNARGRLVLQPRCGPNCEGEQVGRCAYEASRDGPLGKDPAWTGAWTAARRTPSAACALLASAWASLQVKRVLRTSVLLIICRSWVRAPPAPLSLTCDGASGQTLPSEAQLQSQLRFGLISVKSVEKGGAGLDSGASDSDRAVRRAREGPVQPGRAGEAQHSLRRVSHDRSSSRNRGIPHSNPRLAVRRNAQICLPLHQYLGANGHP